MDKLKLNQILDIQIYISQFTYYITEDTIFNISNNEKFQAQPSQEQKETLVLFVSSIARICYVVTYSALCI